MPNIAVKIINATKYRQFFIYRFPGILDIRWRGFVSIPASDECGNPLVDRGVLLPGPVFATD